MNSVKEALNQAVRDLTNAVSEDREKNYEKALELYKAGIKGLVEVKKLEEVTTEQKRKINRKCLQYLTRAEKIKGL